MMQALALRHLSWHFTEKWEHSRLSSGRAPPINFILSPSRLLGNKMKKVKGENTAALPFVPLTEIKKTQQILCLLGRWHECTWL